MRYIQSQWEIYKCQGDIHNANEIYIHMLMIYIQMQWDVYKGNEI